ncbi:MAG TPA: glycine cleavage system protein GcvH [Fimbriimonadaceae bacterium]|nr:glycine cleavage system protein GcvH [Fimbriimonadaceae bacterium]
MNIPRDVKYTKSHEWVRLDGNVATVGITDFAQSELGDVVFVELPAPGRALQVDESFGSVESVKTVSDVYAPVAGQVVEVNPSLAARSELINSEPYGDGWLIKIEVSDPSQLDTLMDADTYKATIGQ